MDSSSEDKKILTQFFSFKGRFNRSSFWLYFLLFSLLSEISLVFTEWGFSEFNTPGYIKGLFYLIRVLVFGWIGFSINVKRCHDRNRSGWFILASLIPFVNIWYLIDIGIMGGTKGVNRFGPEPDNCCSFWAVFKRELKGYFATPVAYVFLVIFLLAAGYFQFKDGFFEIRQADLRLFFNNLPLFFVFFVSAVAMRLWAEERKSGSIELLLTLPITVPQAVLGKFFAAWFFLGIALLLTLPIPVTVAYLGNPDMGQIAVGYLGSFLMAGSFLAVGMSFSALTKNQVISVILSVVACLVLLFAGHPSSLNYIASLISPAAADVFEMLSFQNHFDSIMRGVVELKDIMYFVILMVSWVCVCGIILEERKAS